MSAELFRFANNTILAASAGTGKTHSLVGVLTHLLLGAHRLTDERHPVTPSRIVATTFSKRAAREIRERLTKTLIELSSDHLESNVYFEGLLETVLEADDAGEVERSRSEGVREIRRRAHAALREAHTLHFGTIHSIALELILGDERARGGGEEFELRDEEELRNEARETIAKILIEYPDTARAETMVRSAGGFDELVEGLLAQIDSVAEVGLELTNVPVASPKEALTSFEKLLRSDIELHLVSENAALAKDVSSLLDRRAPALVDRLGDYFETFLKGKKASANAPALRGDYGSNVRDSGEIQAAMLLAREEIEATWRATHDVLVRADHAIRASRLERGIASFSGVLTRLRDRLRDEPEAAAEIGARFDALLVDEFQDTSPLQHEILRLLWEDNPKARAKGTVPPLSSLRKRGLLVVGDRKQSIYGFRGAEVSGFSDFALALAGDRAKAGWGIEDERSLGDGLGAAFVPLVHNRRSSEAILGFANAFNARFLTGSGRPYEIEYRPAFEDLKLPPATNAAIAQEPASKVVRWIHPAMQGESTRRQATNLVEDARAVADGIVNLLENEKRASGERVAPKDIAVIALTNRMLETVAFTLAAAGIPYVVAGQGFFSNLEVKDVLALLALAVDDTDRLAAISVLRGPCVGLSDESLLFLSSQKGLLPIEEWKGVELPEDERIDLARLVDVVRSMQSAFGRETVGEMLDRAIEALSLRDVLARMPRGIQRVANVDKLVAMANDAIDPSQFLGTLRAREARSAREASAALFSEDDDAVRLLTVHASKGLDFPIVFMPGVGGAPVRADGLRIFQFDRTRKALSSRFVDRNGRRLLAPAFLDARNDDRDRREAERRRLFYVALTRPRELLVLVGDRREAKQSTTGVLHAATILRDLEKSSLVEPFSPPVRRTWAGGSNADSGAQK